MGLAAAKNKRRIGTDPNNTRWSRNTDTFGQKILRAHGWQPGQFLGVQDAAHSHLLTDASASHIRVVLKEDNMGLGAKRNNGDECVGLDAFQHLLGRLNGKTEEVLESERVAREGVKLTLYADRKWGPMRFVRGGLLVGDEIKESPKEELVIKKETVKVEVIKTEAVDTKENLVASAPTTPEASQDDVKPKKSKKRKAEEPTEAKEGKKEKKSKRRKTEDDAEENSTAELSTKKKEKKSRKSKKDESHRAEEGKSSKSKKDRRKEKEAVVEGDISEPQSSAEEPEAEVRSKSKKSEKKSKKEKSKDKKLAGEDTGDSGEKSSKKKRRRKEEDVETSENVTPEDSTATDTLPTPVASGHSTPDPAVSARHLARRRFIAQKRLAFADPKALSQIFMIKS